MSAVEWKPILPSLFGKSNIKSTMFRRASTVAALIPGGFYRDYESYARVFGDCSCEPL